MRPWRTQAHERAQDGDRDRVRSLAAGFDRDSDTDPDFFSLSLHLLGSLPDAIARTQVLSRIS